MIVASGPDAVDWLVGFFRAYHPLRWFLCLVGVTLTGLSAVMARSLCGNQPLDFAGWCEHPIEHAQSLWGVIFVDSFGLTLLRGGVLLTLNASLWSLIGGLIARPELVARHAHDENSEQAVKPGGTAFLLGSWKALLGCFPCGLLMVVILLVPVAVSGLINAWFNGFGTLLVALFLPVVLLADLILLAIVLGSLSWFLMPIAVADGCDQYGAMAFGYGYVFNRPIHFGLFSALALALAFFPLGLLLPFSDSLARWSPGVRLVIFLGVTALSASIFWSLQVLVYLHLSAMKDVLRTPKIEDTPLAERPVPQENSLVWVTIISLPFTVGTWFLTYWLLSHFSSGSTEWLAWGMNESLVPRVEGSYRAASIIAAFWGVACVLMPFFLLIRQRLKNRKLCEGAVKPEATPRVQKGGGHLKPPTQVLG
jgi:hypothetical protein